MPAKRLTLELRALKAGDHIDGFAVGDNDFQPLADFFKADAIPFEGASLARTYVMAQRSGGRIYAYMTLVVGELTLTANDNFLGQGINYPYKKIPAVKLARLLVDHTLRGSGIGKSLVDFALGETREKICPTAGCRFMILDAKRKSIGFYEKQGFTMLDTPKNKARQQPLMFIDLHKAS